MRADYRVVLDACVLIPMPLADTLLRLAEEPRLYLPKWSQTIMADAFPPARFLGLDSPLFNKVPGAKQSSTARRS